MGNLMQPFKPLFRYSIVKIGILVIALFALAGCSNTLYGAQLMRFQPRYDPLEASPFFEDGHSARTPVEDTVARGQLRLDELMYSGRVDGKYATDFPMPITRDVLERGQERFNIFCAPCHGAVGDGQGMVVQRGFKQPPSFHIDRLRQVPPGYFFYVMTNGFGSMYSYNARVSPEDRWAITAYIRVLQLSQYSDASVVPADDMQKLEGQ